MLSRDERRRITKVTTSSPTRAVAAIYAVAIGARSGCSRLAKKAARPVIE